MSIAHGTSLISANHTWEDSTIPIKYNKMEEKEIVIADDVWIGAKVTILAGVTIESRCVVAAGAVVTKNVKEHTVVGGVPAKVIKEI